MRKNVSVCLVCMLAAMLVLTGCGGGGAMVTIAPSFTLSAAPASLSVGQGGSATTTITVTGQNGFNGSVSLSASGLRSGETVSFNPSSTTTTSVLTLIAASATATGATTLTVIGSSSSLLPTTPISLTVAVPSVTVTVSPLLAAVAAASQTQQFTPTVIGNMGNTSVTWNVDGTPGGSTTVGTISASGLYTPPATGGTHTVTATSVALPTSSASASIAVTDLAGVFTHHNDLSRDGANTQEYALTSSTVKTTTFGKLFSCPVDGAVYTQPLWVPGLSVNGAKHNVVFVATQHDSLFAFDADASPCVTYWQANLLDPVLHGGTNGETPITWNDVGNCYGDIYPEVGVTGTPVIDPTTNTIYVVSASMISTGGSGNCSGSQGTFYQRLHALDLQTGNEQPQLNSPVTIAASVPGIGDGGTVVNFNAQMENQRLGLALAGGTVYVGWSAHEDASPWHGWLIGYSTANLQRVSVFNTSPNGGAGGIWAGGGAPAVDSEGNLYVATGNGVFDANTTVMADNDYGDSILKLVQLSGNTNTANGVNLNLVDYFTPDNQSCLSNSDTDLGAGDPVVLPDQTSGPVLHLLVQIGKEGVVYVVNRDNMGQLQTNNCAGSNTQIVQTFVGSPSGFYGTPAFWQNGLYFAGSLDNTGSGDYLKLFALDSTTGQFNMNTPPSQSEHYYNFPGASPSVSSQGVTNGIVWAIDASAYGYANPNAGSANCFQVPVPAPCSGPAVLHAYDAADLTTEYWNSTLAANNRDQAGNAVKFAPPTVANGKVYVSTRTEIDVYGLLPN
jgi:hypothetical protein